MTTTTTDEAAALAGVTLRQLYYWQARGYLAGDRVGGHREIRLGRADVVRVVALTAATYLARSFGALAAAADVVDGDVVADLEMSNGWRVILTVRTGSRALEDAGANLRADEPRPARRPVRWPGRKVTRRAHAGNTLARE